MSFQACYCGAAPGYAHRPNCPRPLFRASAPELARWLAERAQLLAEHERDKGGRR